MRARSCRSTRNPRPIYRLDGKPWRGRIQTYDAPFSLEKTDSFTLHAQETGQASYIRGQAAHADVRRPQRLLGSRSCPYVGVKVPRAGVKMQVLSQDGHRRCGSACLRRRPPSAAKVKAAKARAKAANRIAQEVPLRPDAPGAGRATSRPRGYAAAHEDRA